MWIFTLGLGLLLSSIHGGQATHHDPQYMLLVSSLIKAGHDQKFCLQLSHLNETLRVTVVLEAEENVTLLEKQVTQPEEYNCFMFEAPEVKNAMVAYVTFEAVGDSLHFKTRKSVFIKPLHNLVFMQTDKPIYKPDQEVKFRIVSMNEDFRTTHELFPVIYVEDPNGNRIYQWVNLETKRGIAQESFLLSHEPKQGKYKLIAQRKTGPQVQHPFSVEEYVLPKFQVQVKIPSIITILDEDVKVTACAKYTFGSPVPGTITVRICRRFTQSYSSCPEEENRVCEEFTHEADSKGCFSEVVKTKSFQLRRTGYEMKLNVEAKIKEEGTGVELTGVASSEIKSTIAKVSFQQIDSHYKRGIPFFGLIFLEDAAGKPIANETVTLFIGYDGTNQTYTTGPDGKADFSINTTSFYQSTISLRVTYKTRQSCYSQRTVFPNYQDGARTINHFYSRSHSYVKIQPVFHPLECQVVRPVTVHYALTAEGVKDLSHALFHYLVMSKGEIVSSGEHKLEIEGQESHGQFTFNLFVGVKISPMANMLVYLVLDNGEVIADSVKFEVQKCFANKAKVSFSKDEAEPGSNVDLLLSTSPHSLCALRVVDSSVLLLKPEAELSAKTVYDLLPVRDLSGYHYDGHYLEEPREDPCIKLDPIFMNGVYYTPSSPSSETDTYTILKNFGVKVGTNTMIRTPHLCAERAYAMEYNSERLEGGQYIPMAMARAEMAPRGGMAEPLMVETKRSYFPETWMWDLVAIDDPGKAVLTLTVPDTITTWNVGMFCTSEEEGFGLAEPVSLLTFLPFFLDITMPYSVVRGEVFTLKVTIFNYLKQGVEMKASLEKSEHFTAKSQTAEPDSHCMEANGRLTLMWEVSPTTLGKVNFTVSAQTVAGGGPCGNEIGHQIQGRKDTITNHILVEPEGIEKEETHSAMICGKGPEVIEEISLKLPSQVVEGSSRAYFSAIGDIMGTPLQNLGNLLQMPSGCGEQNIALLTPNIFVLEYLNNTKQLTPELKSKALTYLSTGYQKQLAFKRPDGSYGTFISRSGTGNTWLTAFVLRSFSKAQAHIYIDPKQISDSMVWLSLQQKQNGCFRSVGHLFNTAMKGGVNDEVALTAYITMGLLESKLPATNIVVRNALFCLETALSGENNIYTQALMAYAFTLAGRLDIRSRVLDSLNEHAVKEGNTIHWHLPGPSKDSGNVGNLQRNRKAPSLEVEIAAYVLLAMISKPELSDEDMGEATKVVYWILKQQNPTGGFSSTQDTVVALQAIATYGFHTYQHDGPRDVVVSQDKAEVAKLHVEDSNRLLLQRVALPDIPGDYSVSVSGPGCVFIQSTLKYNIPPPEREAPFNITVTTVPKTCDKKPVKMLGIAVNVSYTGSREHSNMALVEIKLPSGYIPVKSSVKLLQGRSAIQKAESHPNKVVVYFEQLTKENQSFLFFAEQDIAVSNLKPANAKVYDYYEPDDYAVTEYSAPCSFKDEAHNI